MFSKVGFVSSPPGQPRPTEPLTVYRGAPRDVGPLGFSRSLELETAERYALISELRGRPAAVWKAIVPPEAVLAIFHARPESESEVVVDPAYVP